MKQIMRWTMNMLAIMICLLLLISCQKSKLNSVDADSIMVTLENSIEKYIDSIPGTVGVAVVTDHDTVTINNDYKFPLMSVFKLHQALAIALILEKDGKTFQDSILINRDSLNSNTWSPMLKDLPSGKSQIDIKKLVDYAITQSDNNASNLLFNRIADTEITDSFLKSIALDTTFSIRYTEEEMALNHDLSYENYSSPLSSALLIKQVFESPIVGDSSINIIRNALLATSTGADRIPLPISEIKGAKIGHKTGSGYINDKGELIAFNDVAYIQLPDGEKYALAIMIRDFKGNESEAAKVMADISRIVLEKLNRKN